MSAIVDLVSRDNQALAVEHWTSSLGNLQPSEVPTLAYSAQLPSTTSLRPLSTIEYILFNSKTSLELIK